MRRRFQYIPFSKLEMDEYGRLQPDPNRFPSSKDGSGFKALADYVHSLGLKFGIHIMRGIPRKAAHDHLPVIGATTTADMIADPTSISEWNPDMYGVYNNEDGQAYYDSIISMYADWGVDFIKCDDICDSRLFRDRYFGGWHETEMLHKAIKKSGRNIVLSLSPGPAHIDRAWKYCKYANMWRITDDFWDRWDLLKNMFYRCEMWQDHVSEGCFPDCDMLPLGYVGKGFGEERVTNFTEDEQKTMMTLWCMFRSPLMLGAEMTKLDDFTLSLLTNKDLLDLLNENSHGIQLERNDRQAIWKNKDAKTGRLAVALFNLSDEERTITLDLSEIEENLESKDYKLIDIWSKEESVAKSGVISVTLKAHAVAAYKLA
jgi:hypothetical protein